MRGLFKKNQLIITALAALIAVAGYLNCADRAARDNDKKNTQQVEASNNGQDVAQTNGKGTSDTGKDATKEDESKEGETKEDIASTDTNVEGTPGEAIFVNATGTVDFIVEAKLAKEYNRVGAKEVLQGIIDNKELSEAEKKEAVNKMVELLEVSEREMAAENLIMSKGYSDVAVTMTDGYVDVIIVSDELNFSARAQIEDIVKRKMQVEADKITINAISVDDID
jgi:stage III sporulation protein AH